MTVQWIKLDANRQIKSIDPQSWTFTQEKLIRDVLQTTLSGV